MNFSSKPIFRSVTLSLFKDAFGRKWSKGVSITLEELVLHLDPVESETMQEALHLIHAHDDGEGDRPEGWPHQECGNQGPAINGSCRWIRSSRVEDVDELGQDQVEEHFRELTVSKRQGPESQVGGSIGHGTEDELDGLNELMDEGLTEGVLVILS